MPRVYFTDDLLNIFVANLTAKRQLIIQNFLQIKTGKILKDWDIYLAKTVMGCGENDKQTGTLAVLINNSRN